MDVEETVESFKKTSWRQISPSVHLITVVIALVSATASVMAFSGAASPSDRFVKLEERQMKVEVDQSKTLDAIGDIKEKMAALVQGQKDMVKDQDKMMEWLKSVSRHE